MNDWYIDRSKNFISDSFDLTLQILVSFKEKSNDIGAIKKALKETGKFDTSSGNLGAAFTRFRDHGYLSSKNIVGDSAIDYVNNILSKEELIIDLFLKRPAKKTKSPNVKPFVLLCKVFDIMIEMNVDVDDIFLTFVECKKYLYPCNDYDDVTFDLVEKILGERNYDLTGEIINTGVNIDQNEKTNISLWFNALSSTPLFLPQENRELLKPNIRQKEFFKYISVNADEFSETPTESNEKLYEYYCDRQTGLLEILPSVIIQGVKIDTEEQAKILFEYLFGYKKYPNVNYLEYVKGDCFGIFFPFITVPRLAIRKVLLTNREVGERLLNFINQDNIYKFYLDNDNFEYIQKESNKVKSGDEMNNEIYVKTSGLSQYDRNRIIFGAPGTGKSYTLNKEKGELLDKCKNNFERVTFHPEYSYANFVGTYKPVMTTTEYNVSENSEKILKVLTDKSKTAQEKYDLLYDEFKGNGLTRLPLLLGLYTDEAFKTKKQDGSDSSGDNSVERNHGRAIRPYVNLYTGTRKTEEISYEYVPGPFMRVLAKALKSGMTDSPEPYLLIIEEINRANVAAVFGDVFQLLDRDFNNVSEYEISTSKDMRMYLAKELGVDESEVETIKIPDNMFIWATMNSADQGVFPMDTAFKRRWDFTYLGIDDAEDTMKASIKDKKYTFGIGDDARLVSWNDIRKAINNELSNETYRINEDKLLGPYFISNSILLNASNDEFLKVFKNKVLMYLFEDAVKQRRSPFFDNCKDGNKGIRYSEICKAFDTKGVFIFPESISKEFIEKPSDDEPKDTDE